MRSIQCLCEPGQGLTLDHPWTRAHARRIKADAEHTQRDLNQRQTKGPPGRPRLQTHQSFRVRSVTTASIFPGFNSPVYCTLSRAVDPDTNGGRCLGRTTPARWPDPHKRGEAVGRHTSSASSPRRSSSPRHVAATALSRSTPEVTPRHPGTRSTARSVAQSIERSPALLGPFQHKSASACSVFLPPFRAERLSAGRKHTAAVRRSASIWSCIAATRCLR